MEHIIGIIGIAITVLLGVYIHWRANRALLAIFWLVSSLPGGDAATRIYEDICKSKQAPTPFASPFFLLTNE